ncbi:MAG: TetR/AcrR family transcriptional regulator [Gemmatimonadetes bacterium]|nr:TetR/AcrR family transcriptional regulator [Gemmatimonadota bacterium]
MPRPASDVQTRILNTVDKQLRTASAATLTIDRIAAETGCAKGLVTYHFKNKASLVAAAAERLFRERDDRWESALSAATPDEAIHRSWALIVDDVSSGFWKAEAFLAATDNELTVQTVRKAAERFANLLSKSVRTLLHRMALKPSITDAELGYLLAAGTQGFGMQLLNGLSAEHVEGAYAALWLAILSLTKPVRT